MRIGVLTGGGDCPGLNAVIRAVTKSLLRQCGAEVVGIQDGFAGLMGSVPCVHPLDWDDVSGILMQGGTILGTSNRANPRRRFCPADKSAARLDRRAVRFIAEIAGSMALCPCTAAQKPRFSATVSVAFNPSAWPE